MVSTTVITVTKTDRTVFVLSITGNEQKKKKKKKNRIKE